MIIFVSQGKHTYTHQSLAGHPDLNKLKCCNYSWLLRQARLPKGTYILTDRERMDLWELRVFGALHKHLSDAGDGYRVINNPAQALNRRALLRTLYMEGINDFNAYALTEKRLPEQYPVFLRREYDHRRPLSELLHNETELQAALAELREQGEPEDGILIIEYAAEPVEGNLFRKLSAYKVGDQVFFYNTVHEESWLVKYGTLNSATDALYQEELDMITHNAFASDILKVFNLAHIEYGRVDFGLVNGKAQFYEINTNPHIKRPMKEHPNPYRVKSQRLAWGKYCMAINKLDTTDPKAPYAKKFTSPGLIPSMLRRIKYGSNTYR